MSFHINLKIGAVSRGELESSAAAIFRVGTDRYAIVEPQRADRQIQQNTDAPIVIVGRGAKPVVSMPRKIERIGINHTNIVKNCEF